VTSLEQAVADAHRQEWAAVLATTLRVTRDLDLAEECVQDAYIHALKDWARDGIPAKPGAWLTAAARRNALDAFRRAKTFQSKLHLLVEPDVFEMPLPADPVVHDDRLRLIFMCCHPALASEARVALTLRLVCGVSTRDVAHAFLVPEPTMAARVTRAKRKIAEASIPFRIPEADELPDRLDAVLNVIHLLFTNGHTAPSGESLTCEDFAERALDLARLLRDLMPDEREAKGLLALLLLNHARRSTRTASDGRLLLLEEQDRSVWDRNAIAEGSHLVNEALRSGNPGRFTLQAAIAAVHANSRTFADTDWARVIEMYDRLLTVWPSPVVVLNRAAAVSMLGGPSVALHEVEELERDGRLTGYRYLPAIKADLLRRMDRRSEAAAAYRQALDLSDNDAERAFLTRRLTEISMS
jgi:RNA polymerase sigma-70 factor (ECF subfamily)